MIQHSCIFFCMTPEFRSDRLETLMEKRGKLTNQKLAYMSGVSSTMIWNLQNGNRPNASAIVVAKIAEALECSIYYLLGLTDDPKPGGVSPAAMEVLQNEARAISECPPSVRQLAEIASKLPDGLVESLIALARECVEVRRAENERVLQALVEANRQAFGDGMADQMTEVGRRAVDDLR